MPQMWVMRTFTDTDFSSLKERICEKNFCFVHPFIRKNSASIDSNIRYGSNEDDPWLRMLMPTSAASLIHL